MSKSEWIEQARGLIAHPPKSVRDIDAWRKKLDDLNQQSYRIGGDMGPWRKKVTRALDEAEKMLARFHA